MAITASIDKKIYLIRGQRVMLSYDLAALYGVETRVLVQAVKRNIDRFPEDFMFQLSDLEFANLKSQIVISSWGGARRSKPYAFTEQGIAMLSSVLRSKRAIEVNILIMRTFVRIREYLSTHIELARKIDQLERRVVGHDDDIKGLVVAIKQLTRPPLPPKRRIGFKSDGKLA
ncbi:MAG: ORF6N domain-containing protein, partial [Candidatus Helarchaeota archaeon]